MLFGQHTIFHVRTPGIVGSNQKKFNLYNLPKIIRHHEHSQTACNFSSTRIFSECPKCLGKNEIFLQFFYVPEFFGQPIFPKCPQFWSIRNFPECPKIWGRNDKFQTFIIFVGSLNFQNCPNIFQHLEKNSPESSEHQAFPSYQTFEQK